MHVELSSAIQIYHNTVVVHTAKAFAVRVSPNVFLQLYIGALYTRLARKDRGEIRRRSWLPFGSPR